MTKVKILQTTMVAGQRHAKGDVARVDVPTAQDLVALGKAEIVSKKTDEDKLVAITVKNKRKE